jgi:hypothetical protein
VTRSFDVITFDCYGTLIDWEAGITQAFREAAAADGVSLDPAAALRVLFPARATGPEIGQSRAIGTPAEHLIALPHPPGSNGGVHRGPGVRTVPRDRRVPPSGSGGCVPYAPPPRSPRRPFDGQSN